MLDVKLENKNYPKKDRYRVFVNVLRAPNQTNDYPEKDCCH